MISFVKSSKNGISKPLIFGNNLYPRQRITISPLKSDCIHKTVNCAHIFDFGDLQYCNKKTTIPIKPCKTS
jgi:hypothetical protein